MNMQPLSGHQEGNYLGFLKFPVEVSRD